MNKLFRFLAEDLFKKGDRKDEVFKEKAREFWFPKRGFKRRRRAKRNKSFDIKIISMK